MCGIGGIKSKLENRDAALRKMLDSMRFRGPDSQGEYSDDEIALGHRRLKIIDLTSHGDQPMANEGNNIWLVSNCEIYNFRELRRHLEDLGHKFRSQADSEVILHSYEEWGKDCLDKLRGMFSFCIWDKDKKELFLARDRLGIKPLYYYFKGELFVFASEVRGILATEMISKRLELNGLLTYLDYGGLKEPWTMVEGIYSLAPGNYIILNEKEFKIVNYWDLARIATSKPYFKSEEITERINVLLKESVQLHLISEVPLGIFLSGGIDSSSLLSLAAKIAPKIRSISLVFNEEDLSEARYSRLMAKKYRTDHHEVFINHDYLFKNLDNAIASMDEPTFNGINTYFVSRAAKESGLTVALSGLGGDEIFGGYPTFRRISRLIWFCKFWDGAPKIFREIFAGILKSIVPALPQKDKLIELAKEGSILRHPYFWMRRLFTEDQKKRLLKTYTFLAKEDAREIAGLDIINQVSYLEMVNYMRDILLRDTDFMSMAHSLEVRVPFLDHKLVEFMFSVPGRFKMDRHLNKPLLIKSLDESLPETIIKRKKMGFTFPFDNWLRQNLRNEVEQTLRERDTMLDGFINHDSVLEIWKGFQKRHISWERPWAIYVLKKWIKIYLQ